MSFIDQTTKEIGGYINLKGFHAFGFGGFLNFSIPVDEANYLTSGYNEQQQQSDNVGLAPVMAGYRSRA